MGPSDKFWAGVGSIGGVALEAAGPVRGFDTLRGVGGALLLRKKPKFFKFKFGIAIGRGIAIPSGR